MEMTSDKFWRSLDAPLGFCCFRLDLQAHSEFNHLIKE